MNTTLHIIETTDDRCQVVDDRGRLLIGMSSRAEAEAFARGYQMARDDARMLVAAIITDMPARVGAPRR